MRSKSLLGFIKSPRIYDNGAKGNYYVYPRYIYNLSGWPLRRGDHKSPMQHSYSTMKSSGTGKLRLEDNYPSNVRVGAALASGYDVSFSPSLYNEAVAKLSGKVRGDLDLSVDAFQARQTGRMFKAADIISDFDRSLRRGVYRKLNTFVSIAKLAGSLRLQWVYGWKPLIDDFYGVLDEAVRDYVNNFTTFRAVRRREDTQVFIGSVDNTGMHTISFRGELKEFCTVSVTLDTSKMPELAFWTSLNPASIGWELLPFSFVVDWVIDVGSYLRSLETALLFNRSFHSGYLSRLVYMNAESLGSGSKSLTHELEGKWYFRTSVFQRDVLTGFPVPSLPRVNPGLSSPRLWNAISLLTQVKTR